GLALDVLDPVAAPAVHRGAAESRRQAAAVPEEDGDGLGLRHGIGARLAADHPASPSSTVSASPTRSTSSGGSSPMGSLSHVGAGSVQSGVARRDGTRTLYVTFGRVPLAGIVSS